MTQGITEINPMENQRWNDGQNFRRFIYTKNLTGPPEQAPGYGPGLPIKITGKREGYTGNFFCRILYVPDQGVKNIQKIRDYSVFIGIGPGIKISPHIYAIIPR
jgi:hypothetical protein